MLAKTPSRPETGGGLAVEVRAEPGFDFASRDYAELFDRSCATAFQHPLWLEGLYAGIAPSLKAEPVVVTVRARDDGRLMLVLPLVRRRRGPLRVVEFADLGLTDYAVPVCDRAEGEAIAADPRMRRLIRAAIGRFDLLRIAKVREDRPELAELLAPALRQPMATSAHAVPLRAPFSQWRIDTMNASLGRELDQKRRKLGRKGAVRFGTVEDGDAIEAALSRMRDLRKPRFEQRDNGDVLADPAGFAFYRDVAKKGAKASFSRMYVLELDGEAVALAFGLSHKGRFMVLLSAFDIAFKKLSLGNLLFESMIHDCIDRGDGVFDLTTGDESYKQHFGTQPTGLAVLLTGGSLIGSLAARSIERPWIKRLAKWSLRRDP